MLRMLDLFAGIGGFSYAGEKLVGGYETVVLDYDEHAQNLAETGNRNHRNLRDLACADRFESWLISSREIPPPMSQAGSASAIKMTVSLAGNA